MLNRVHMWPALLLIFVLSACSETQATATTAAIPPAPTAQATLAGSTAGSANTSAPAATSATVVPTPQIGANGQITPNAPKPGGGTLPGFYFYVQEYNIWEAGATVKGTIASGPEALGGKQITKNPDLSFSKDPALSPDGTLLAYSYSPPPQMVNGKSAVGADIDILDVRTGKTSMVIARKSPYDFLEQPVWSSDGHTVYYSYHGPLYDKDNRVVGESYALESYDVTTSTRTQILKDSLDPAVSPDGKTLAFVTINPDTYENGLGLYDLVNKKLTVLNRPDQNFLSFASPRWSPDGKTLAFAAVGGPGVNLGALQNQQTPTPAAQSDTRYSFDPAALSGIHLLPNLHGVPWDLWLWPMTPVAPNPHRLTTLYEDQPVPAWSKDGKTLGFIAGFGLYSIAPDGSQLKRFSEIGAHGGFTWRDTP